MTAMKTRILNFDAIENSSLQTEPFWFMVARDVIPAGESNRINAHYPKITIPTNCNPEDLEYGPGFRQVLEDLNSDAFERLIEKKFAIDLRDAAKTITVRRYSEMSDGHIHTDHWSKIITVLIYFNESWDQEGGKLRMLRGKADIEDYLVEVPPLYGTLLAFKRSSKSFHGYKPFEGERRMVQVNWVNASLAARQAHRLSRWGTHTGKRILRFFQNA